MCWHLDMQVSNTDVGEKEGSGVTAVFRFPASHWRGCQRSNGETGGKHIWYPPAGLMGVTHADKSHEHALKIK